MSNTPQQPPRSWGGTSKTIAFWVLVLLVPVAFIQFSNARADARVELNVSQYEQQLDANNVAAINISSDRHVNGDFRQKVAVDGHSGKKFHVLLPGPLTERERDQLRANKVVVASSEAGQSFGTLLIAWLPVILIIAIWIFIFRQMQAGCLDTCSQRCIAGRMARTSRNSAMASKVAEIGRVRNTVASPRAISMARRRFSSISGPRMKPRIIGAGSQPSFTQM